MVKVGFHYMNEKKWGELQHNNDGSGVIAPRQRLIILGSVVHEDVPELPDWAHDGYIFAFPDREAPEPWGAFKQYQYEWGKLTQGIGNKIVGIRFDLLSSDDAYVIERAHYADWQWGVNSDKQDAIRKYALSRVPASEYDGSFRMPELLIKNPIGLERLTVHTSFTRELVKKDERWAVEYRPSL